MTFFDVIVADPPWSFDDELKKMKRSVKRSASSHYNTMTTADVCSLPVNEVANPQGCVLGLWVPSTLLPDGLRVMSAWGFTLKQTFVWVKNKDNWGPFSQEGNNDLNDLLAFGMGRLFRQTHEIALIGTSGKSVQKSLKNRSQRSVMIEPNEGHSVKPDEFQERLELMFPEANRLEMFARRTRVGWTCLGNEIDGQDIRAALNVYIPPKEEKDEISSEAERQ